MFGCFIFVSLIHCRSHCAASPGEAGWWLKSRKYSSRSASVTSSVMTAQEQDIGALRLNGQTDLGLNLEVQRGAALDQIDEGKMPEVEGQLHERELILLLDNISTGFAPSTIVFQSSHSLPAIRCGCARKSLGEEEVT